MFAEDEAHDEEYFMSQEDYVLAEDEEENTAKIFAEYADDKIVLAEIAAEELGEENNENELMLSELENGDAVTVKQSATTAGKNKTARAKRVRSKYAVAPTQMERKIIAF